MSNSEKKMSDTVFLEQLAILQLMLPSQPK